MNKFDQLMNLVEETAHCPVYINVDVDYGLGFLVIKEIQNGYEFYFVDRAVKFDRTFCKDIDELIMKLGYSLSDSDEVLERYLSIIGKNKTLKLHD